MVINTARQELDWGEGPLRNAQPRELPAAALRRPGHSAGRLPGPVSRPVAPQYEGAGRLSGSASTREQARSEHISTCRVGWNRRGAGQGLRPGRPIARRGRSRSRFCSGRGLRQLGASAGHPTAFQRPSSAARGTARAGRPLRAISGGLGGPGISASLADLTLAGR